MVLAQSCQLPLPNNEAFGRSSLTAFVPEYDTDLSLPHDFAGVLLKALYAPLVCNEAPEAESFVRFDALCSGLFMEGELHLAAFHSCEFSGLNCVFSTGSLVLHS